MMHVQGDHSEGSAARAQFHIEVVPQTGKSKPVSFAIYTNVNVTPCYMVTARFVSNMILNNSCLLRIFTVCKFYLQCVAP